LQFRRPALIFDVEAFKSPRSFFRRDMDEKVLIFGKDL